MDMQHLRCHLLIGPAASGKSTLASVLAELTGSIVISTDAIRAELFGGAAIQGTWAEVERLFHQRLIDAVAAGQSVILDGTHCQRPWRLALIQALELHPPVQWIGWWLITPLAQCKAWNRLRERQVDEEVILRQFQMLPNAKYEPSTSMLKKLDASPTIRDKKLKELSKIFEDRKRNELREEGFADVVMINPSMVTELSICCRDALHAVDANIDFASKRRERVRLHRYSRLLDQERLLYLIQLLLEYPGLNFVSRSTASASTDIDDVNGLLPLQASFRYSNDDPLPNEVESFAGRAAFVLAHRHGPCYGDLNAVVRDLDWLQQQGFVAVDPVLTKVEPGPPTSEVLNAMAAGAGFPAAADRQVFQRQLSLLRHLIQNPFDRSPTFAELDRDILGEGNLHRGRRRVIAASSSSMISLESLGSPLAEIASSKRLRIPNVRENLLHRLEAIAEVSYNGQVRRLDKDIENLLTPYGFRNPLPMASSENSANKPKANRRGIALGTALLTASQLKEVHTLIEQSYRNLKDPTVLELQRELEERLSMAGVDVESILPVRGIANRSIIDPENLGAKTKNKTIALPGVMEKVEGAILERRKIRLKIIDQLEVSVGTPHGKHKSKPSATTGANKVGDTAVLVWPLQILFHNIAWYLAYESDDVGSNKGLLSIARLDRLELLDILREQRQVQAARDSQERLGHLCRRSGGIYLGSNATHQFRVGVKDLNREQIKSLERDGIFQVVRFRCTESIVGVFRNANNRYPREQMRLDLDSEINQQATHPYPVELILPVWTVTQERDFKRWLFGFGDQVQIETPNALREEHRRFGAGIADLYAPIESTSCD